jgi:acyl carrier protein
MKPEIIEKVNEFLTEEFEIDLALLTPEARIVEDLGIESLDFVDIVVIIERDFGFKVKREDMAGIRTLEDLYKYIGSRAV